MTKKLGLKNVNMLNRTQYNNIAAPTNDELWAVESDTYSDEFGNWYRVYPDGWCEQGGELGDSYTAYTTKVLSFLKPFANTSYFVTVQPSNTDDLRLPTITVKTNTAVTFINTYNKDALGGWFACGYIA